MTILLSMYPFQLGCDVTSNNYFSLFYIKNFLHFELDELTLIIHIFLIKLSIANIFALINTAVRNWCFSSIIQGSKGAAFQR